MLNKTKRESAVRKLRKKLGYTQEDFAYYVNTSYAAYVSYELEKRYMPYDVALRIQHFAKKNSIEITTAKLM
jgi:DNA-binding XRE family transcriptional regulator